jgi:hypothetical protein
LPAPGFRRWLESADPIASDTTASPRQPAQNAPMSGEALAQRLARHLPEQRDHAGRLIDPVVHVKSNRISILGAKWPTPNPVAPITY